MDSTYIGAFPKGSEDSMLITYNHATGRIASRQLLEMRGAVITIRVGQCPKSCRTFGRIPSTHLLGARILAAKQKVS